MANPELPQEMLLEIFSRIPAKSVGKCRTLSKSWNTHLSTPHFVKKHLVTRKHTIQHVALASQFHELCIITPPTKIDQVFNSVNVQHECRFFIGSCNGLILFSDDDNCLILMNPITLKKVTVKAPNLGRDFILAGFGYDSCPDDYKIVRLRYARKNVDVYSVKNGVWRRAGDVYPYGGLVPRKRTKEGGAFVNGALHWLVEGYRSCIAAFYLANEVFREIPLLKGFIKQLENECLYTTRTYGVSVVGECLVIIHNFGNGVTEVWIMKEYGVAESWVKFRIGAEDVIHRDSIVSTLCYVQDGELLCLRRWDNLVACDLNGETERRVDYRMYFHSGIAFVDSLVFPEVCFGIAREKWI